MHGRDADNQTLKTKPYSVVQGDEDFNVVRGDNFGLENYRPVLLLSCIGKVPESF